MQFLRRRRESLLVVLEGGSAVEMYIFRLESHCVVKWLSTRLLVRNWCETCSVMRPGDLKQW